jgi:hypothetical protein
MSMSETETETSVATEVVTAAKPKFNRRHYKVIADVLKASIAEGRVGFVARNLASAFEADNSTFSRRKFYKAIWG